MKNYTVALMAVCLSFCVSSCEAKAKKAAKRVPVTETIDPVFPNTSDAVPQGYFIKDSKGVLWLLTVSANGQLVIRQVPK